MKWKMCKHYVTFFFIDSIGLLDINQLNKIYILLGMNNANPASETKKLRSQNGGEAGRENEGEGKVSNIMSNNIC